MRSVDAATGSVAVVGLGVMGTPIAANLARAGFDVVGHTRTPPRRSPVPLAATAGEAFARAGAVVLTVPGLTEAHAVVAAAGDAVAGRLVALAGTVDPAGSRAFGEALAAAGARYVEAPVAGSAVQAAEGSLLVLASAAERADAEALAPVFAAIARRTLWCGPPPNAMTIKLANNLVQIGLFEALAEATVLIERSGLELELLYDVLTSGAMANRVLEAKTALVRSGDLSPQAPLRHVHKDIALAQASARRLGLDLPGVDAGCRTFARALDAGLGDLDAMAILRVLDA